MDRPARYLLTHLWTWPWDLISWFAVLCIWLFWGTKLHWLGGLWCELKKNSWPTRTWYRKKDEHGSPQMHPIEKQVELGMWKTWGGSTLGHGGFYGPGRSGGEGIDTEVEFHEHVHVEQFEVALWVSFLYACAVFVHNAVAFNAYSYWLCGAIWLSGFAVFYCCALIQAWLRGESAYKGSTLEEAAYSLAEDWERQKQGK